MIRFVQNNPLRPPLQYSLESYEPLVLKPEEEKQNSNFIRKKMLSLLNKFRKVLIDITLQFLIF